MGPRNRWSVLRFAGTMLLALGFLVANSSLAQEKEGPFRDADDGQLDVGDSLLERNRFLPIPILISEPAVEMGLGLAVAFFHKEEDDPGDRPPRPSISGIAGAYTGNDSWMAGGGHLGYWKQDTIRYTGFGGVGSVNLDFYVSDQPFAYSMDALFLLQDLKFRLGQSNFFLGGRFSYLDVDALFESSDSIPGVDPEAGESTNASLGAVLHYDTRDNQFTPGRGLGAWLTYSFFGSAFGGDFDYEQIEVKAFSYHPLHKRFVLGLRADYSEVQGRAPFYGLPFVELRGIPLGRFQDQRVGVGELEGRWSLAGRWSLVGFGGAGRIDGDIPLLSEQETVWASGVGFRYLLARDLGLHVGLDVAQGPEDTVVYIQVGSAWH